jgi:hypothetical protein
VLVVKIEQPDSSPANSDKVVFPDKGKEQGSVQLKVTVFCFPLLLSAVNLVW